MFANTSTAPQELNPISQWEDDGGPVNPSATNQVCGVNVGMIERAMSAYVGGSLVTWGLSRRSFPGLFIAAFGGALVYRGATGHCRLYDKLGMSTAGQDSALAECITGNASNKEIRDGNQCCS